MCIWMWLSGERTLMPMQEMWVRFLGREDALEKEMQPTPQFLPGESHAQKSLAGYSLWGCGRVRHGLVTEQQYYSIACMFHIFFVQSSADGRLGCFHVLAVVNSAAVNAGVHASFCIMVFSGYVPSSGIAGSCGNPIISFLRNLHTGLPSGCISFHSHQQCRRILF